MYPLFFQTHLMLLHSMLITFTSWVTWHNECTMFAICLWVSMPQQCQLCPNMESWLIVFVENKWGLIIIACLYGRLFKLLHVLPMRNQLTEKVDRQLALIYNMLIKSRQYTDLLFTWLVMQNQLFFPHRLCMNIMFVSVCVCVPCAMRSLLSSGQSTGSTPSISWMMRVFPNLTASSREVMKLLSYTEQTQSCKITLDSSIGW